MKTISFDIRGPFEISEFEISRNDFKIFFRLIIDSPSPRAPDPKSSLSSHVQVDLGAQYGPVRDALHRLNTPHPVAKISDTTEDIMRNKCDSRCCGSYSHTDVSE